MTCAYRSSKSRPIIAWSLSTILVSTSECPKEGGVFGEYGELGDRGDVACPGKTYGAGPFFSWLGQEKLRLGLLGEVGIVILVGLLLFCSNISISLALFASMTRRRRFLLAKNKAIPMTQMTIM